jgi:hypothetical protein
MERLGVIYNFFILLICLIAVSCSHNENIKNKKQRVMVLIFDQMRAEYIDRFDMKNFKRAQSFGINFENGIVGHLESNTIISHPVVQTGKLPKHLPWGTHAMKDVHGYLGKKNAYYSPFGLSTTQWLDLHKRTSGDSSLIARVKTKYKGPTLAVAQKKYAAVNYGGPYADSIVSLGSRRKITPLIGYFDITGVNVPDYISKPVGNRFYIDGRNDWGSTKKVYQFKGNSFITGNEPKRLGGDIWVGDVVEQFMNHNPDWSVIMASFGSIDKVSHVLHEHDKPTKEQWAVKNKITLKEAIRKADLEMGRILDRLTKEGWDKETTIVITADHAGQHSKHFHGTDKPKFHVNNLYYGKGENFDMRKKYPKKISHLVKTNLIQVASLNTLMSFWMKDMTALQKSNYIKLLAKTSGVAEVWQKEFNGNNYFYSKQFESKKMSTSEKEWAQLKNGELVDTLASATGPDYIATLFDQNGYDVPGSHGGAQELVQRIPFIVIAPNLKSKGTSSKKFVRLVDVNPLIGKILGLDDHRDLDGSYSAITPYLD